MINVISVPQALRIQFIATLKARRGPCIAVPQGAAVVPIITFPLTIVHSNFHCYLLLQADRLWKIIYLRAYMNSQRSILYRAGWPSGCNFGTYSTVAMTLVDKRTVESVSTSRAHVVTDTFVKTYVSGVFKRSEPLQAGNGAEKSFRWAKWRDCTDEVSAVSNRL